MGNPPPAHEKESRPELTQNQLHELLESDQARSLIEGAEERGYVEPAEIEAFALEHELSDEDAEQVKASANRANLQIGQFYEGTEKLVL